MKEKRAVKIGGGKTKIVHMYTYVRTGTNETSFDLTQFDELKEVYKDLTNENFFINNVKIYAHAFNTNCTARFAGIGLTYTPETGILKLTGMSKTGDSSMQLLVDGLDIYCAV